MINDLAKVNAMLAHIMRIHADLKLLPVYALMIPMWLSAGVSKLMEGGVPAWFQAKFGSSLIATFPGVPLAFYMIAVLETVAGLMFALSLVMGEFKAKRARPLMQLGIWLSLGLFAMLGFGMRMIDDHTGAASLFFYFGATAAIAIYLEVVKTAE